MQLNSRKLLAITATTFVIIFGISNESFWQNIPVKKSDRKTTSDPVPTGDTAARSWSISPYKTFSTLTEKTLSSANSFQTSEENLDIDGQIKFPSENPPERLTITVEIFPIPWDRKSWLKPDNDTERSLRQIFNRIEKTYESPSLKRTLRVNDPGQFSIKNTPVGIYEISVQENEWTIANNAPFIRTPRSNRLIEIELERTESKD